LDLRDVLIQINDQSGWHDRISSKSRLIFALS